MRKKTEESTVISVRVSNATKELLDQEAKEQQITLNQLVEQGINLRLAIPGNFWKDILKASWDFQIPASLIIINGILKKVAFEAAWLEVFGSAAPSSVTEFRFTDKGMIRGDELFNQLMNEYKSTLIEAKAKLEQCATEGKGVVLKKSEVESIFRGLQCQMQ